MRGVAALIVTIAGGCRVPDLDVEGKPCPCPNGYACVNAVCTRASSDAASDADPDLAHVTVARGWKVELLADLTGVVPYKPMDFQDGTGEVLDNAPSAIAALYAPFTAAFAIAAGRSVIELAADGTTKVHDYRPAVPDLAGPDNISHLCVGAPPDVNGVKLWIGASSQGNGDGLYYVGTDWSLVTDAVLNNVNGVACDNTGGYEGRGTPAIYVVDQVGFLRRDTSSSFNTLSASQYYGYIATTATVAFTTSDIGTGSIMLVRVFATTHVVQTITMATDLRIAEGIDAAATSVVVLRDVATLASYANDGTHLDIASSTDPDWQWSRASAPQPPHPLAGGYVIVESNRALDRDRLLLISPSP